MVTTPVYLDNQSTTRVDPRVLEAMLPYFSEKYGNAGSTSHIFGTEALDAVRGARETIAACLGAHVSEIVFTSGATESNNLALRGVVEHPRRRGNHLISVATEHKAILDPLNRLGSLGFDITLLQPTAQGTENAGWVDPQQVADAITEQTALVTIMHANNEIGVLQPLAEIGEICRQRGVLLHTDATQSVGKIPVNVQQLGVDLLSCSAHKAYGPKGIGALYVRRRAPAVRLASQIDGGGQQGGRRSGTLNVPGIVGFASALEICRDAMPAETDRIRELRNAIWEELDNAVAEVQLNGPYLDQPEWRLAGNLNVCFGDVEGAALMLNMPSVAVSSGSACTSANPEPSHVLRAIGLSEDATRSSLRFGVGRFNTPEEVSYAVSQVAANVKRLRKIGGKAI